MTPQLREFVLPLRVDDHGDVRIGTTRVVLDMIVYSFLQGNSPERIVQQYPTLELPDVYAAIAYYLRNREEVDAYVRSQEEAGDQLRREIEGETEPKAFREKLLSRVGKSA